MKNTYPNFMAMYKELSDMGYPDINDFENGTAYINAVKPIPEKFIEIVLKWLPKLEKKTGIIMFLRESGEKYDGRVLIPLFEEANTQERWRICEAIAYNPPMNIKQWVKELYLNKKYSYHETGLLPLAIVKMFPKNEAREILKQGFDHQNRVSPEALGKIGILEDIPFLEEKLLETYDATHVKKDIEKAIQRIKKHNN